MLKAEAVRTRVGDRRKGSAPGEVEGKKLGEKVQSFYQLILNPVKQL